MVSSDNSLMRLCRRWLSSHHRNSRRIKTACLASSAPTEQAVKISRRQVLGIAAGAAAYPATSRFASAQTYPSRPVRIIVGFAAGGPNDILARLIGQWLSERLRRAFACQKHTGAGRE